MNLEIVALVVLALWVANRYLRPLSNNAAIVVALLREQPDDWYEAYRSYDGPKWINSKVCTTIYFTKFPYQRPTHIDVYGCKFRLHAGERRLINKQIRQRRRREFLDKKTAASTNLAEAVIRIHKEKSGAN